MKFKKLKSFSWVECGVPVKYMVRPVYLWPLDCSWIVDKALKKVHWHCKASAGCDSSMVGPKLNFQDLDQIQSGVIRALQLCKVALSIRTFHTNFTLPKVFGLIWSYILHGYILKYVWLLFLDLREVHGTTQVYGCIQKLCSNKSLSSCKIVWLIIKRVIMHMFVWITFFIKWSILLWYKLLLRYNMNASYKFKDYLFWVA